MLKLDVYDVMKSYEALGHVRKEGQGVLNMKKAVPKSAVREEYNPLPSFMIRQATRNGVEILSEKALAEVEAEKWKFYDPPTSFKLYSNSQISKLKTKLKAIMREKSFKESQQRLLEAKKA